MKYLNRYKNLNEGIKYERPIDIEEVNYSNWLQSQINLYNDILQMCNDKDWENFYSEIDSNKIDSNFLVSVRNFAEERILHIEEENLEIIEEVKSLIQDIEEDFDEYVTSTSTERVGLIGSEKHENMLKELSESFFKFSPKLEILSYLILNKKFLKERREDNRFSFSSNEVINFFPVLSNIVNSLNKIGLDVRVNFRENSDRINLKIKRNDQ
jgi:hypothetical protein